MGNRASNETDGGNPHNSGSSPIVGTTSIEDDTDDFEAIDKPASPTFMTVTTNPNDLFNSGILVDLPQEDQALLGKRRIVKAVPTPAKNSKASVSTLSTPARTTRPVILSSRTIPDTPANPSGKAETVGITTSDIEFHSTDNLVMAHLLSNHPSLGQQSDDELLQESLAQDKQQRLQKLQSEQKSKRNKAIEDRRKLPDGERRKNSAKANPFSRFLSAFSVEPAFPSHKRPLEENLGGGAVDDAKRPKLGTSFHEDDPEDDSMKRSAMMVMDWLDDNIPGWPWMVAATAMVGLLVSFRSGTSQTAKQLQLLQQR